MDEMTQQNAALVEQAAAAAESLQDQASSLAEAVAVFRVPGVSSARLSAPRTAGGITSRQLPRPGAKLPKPAASSDGEWEEF
jgi:methyl-accepting chemotaxis protein